MTLHRVLELANQSLHVRVSPRFGAVLDGHTEDGRPILRSFGGGMETFRAADAACFAMVPVCNRVEGNGFELDGRRHAFRPNTTEPWYIHGDGWLAGWVVEEAAASHVRLVLEQARPVLSPHAYRAVQTIALDGATLRLGLHVTNLGPEPMPFGIGFHPYFPRGPQTLLEAPAAEWWTEGPGMLPLQREPLPDDVDFSVARPLPQRRLNHCFEGWSGVARIHWPDTGLSATLAADAVFSHLMLYALEEDRSFFCLEPMSHMPNALAVLGPSGLRVLAPGEMLDGGFSMTISEHDTTHRNPR